MAVPQHHFRGPKQLSSIIETAFKPTSRQFISIILNTLPNTKLIRGEEMQYISSVEMISCCSNEDFLWYGTNLTQKAWNVKSQTNNPVEDSDKNIGM